MQIVEIRSSVVQRDMDLIRTLLLRIDADPMCDGMHWLLPDKSSDLGGLDISGHSFDEVAYHLNLLIEAGFLKGRPPIDPMSMPVLSRLTWQGHEFLDDIRDESIWTKTKERLKGLPSVALSVVMQIAEAEIKKKLGL
jgi:hypothetical protein